MSLVEYCLSWGQWPPGEAGARAYEAENGLPDPQVPCRALLGSAMVAYFRGGRDGARSVLVAAEPEVLKGMVRLLFVVAAGSGGALPEEQIVRLMRTVCKDVL